MCINYYGLTRKWHIGQNSIVSPFHILRQDRRKLHDYCNVNQLHNYSHTRVSISKFLMHHPNSIKAISWLCSVDDLFNTSYIDTNNYSLFVTKADCCESIFQVARLDMIRIFTDGTHLFYTTLKLYTNNT